MPRTKTEISRSVSMMCIEYFVSETTTHKTILPDGSILRTDLKGFYVKETPKGISSWFGSSNLGNKEQQNYEWEKEDWKRSYTAEYDFS
jgi:hypothetical protein